MDSFLSQLAGCYGGGDWLLTAPLALLESLHRAIPQVESQRTLSMSAAAALPHLKQDARSSILRTLTNTAEGRQRKRQSNPKLAAAMLGMGYEEVKRG